MYSMQGISSISTQFVERNLAIDGISYSYAAPSTLTVSGTATVTGAGELQESSGLEYSVNGGAWQNRASVRTGDTFQVRATTGSLWDTDYFKTFNIVNQQGTMTSSYTWYLSTRSCHLAYPYQDTTFRVPTGVTSMSICAIGQGGYGANTGASTSYGGPGGGGGGLSFTNNIAVTPDETLDISYLSQVAISRGATILVAANHGSDASDGAAVGAVALGASTTGAVGTIRRTGGNGGAGGTGGAGLRRGGNGGGGGTNLGNGSAGGTQTVNGNPGTGGTGIYANSTSFIVQSGDLAPTAPFGGNGGGWNGAGGGSTSILTDQWYAGGIHYGGVIFIWNGRTFSTTASAF